MKPVSDSLHSFNGTAIPRVRYQRATATDLGLNEAWLRDAIFADPELVIGPCRAAGLTDDEWFAWRREFSTEVGPIDVLLVSSQGRLGLVETKLCSNPELRRKVLAQALDYLVHLPDEFADEIPDLPVDGDGKPVADADDVREAVAQGDVLVVIASDEIDARVGRLSRSLLLDNPVTHWELALVDLALYRSTEGADHIIVPHVRYVVETERRHVVRVIVQGENPKARVEVERVGTDEPSGGTRIKWDQQRFFESLDTLGAPGPVQQLARDLVKLSADHPETVHVEWGSGSKGSMVLKRNDGGLIEVHGPGYLRFRPKKFERALGEQTAREYRAGLTELVPAAMTMTYPKVSESESASKAPAVLKLVTGALDSASKYPHA